MDDFFRNIRSFLGIPRINDRNRHDEDERFSDEFNDSRYDVFSDPMDMHRYFEEQMNKILRNFDIFEFGKPESFFGEIPGYGNINLFEQSPNGYPQLEPDQKSHSLRDQFLKPGFERPSQDHHKTDQDLDENKININDLDSVVSGKLFRKEFEHPNTPNPKVTTRFFGKSISTKTVMTPDGMMEIHKTVRDNEGNEETTITKRIGDKEHTIVKKKDSSGKEEITENLINIDEKDSTNALLTIPNHNVDPLKHWSLFDKFFK